MDGEGGEEKGRKLNGVGEGNTEQGQGEEEKMEISSSELANA